MPEACAIHVYDLVDDATKQRSTDVSSEWTISNIVGEIGCGGSDLYSNIGSVSKSAKHIATPYVTYGSAAFVCAFLLMFVARMGRPQKDSKRGPAETDPLLSKSTI